MPTIETFLVFAGAALVVLVIPGPAVAYVVARSLSQGRRAGLVSALGTASGIFVHVLGAVAGLGALLASSAVAFAVVKYLGAAYLVGLGIRKLLERGDPSVEAQPRAARSARRIYAEAVLVNVLNPKPALFVLAFLPQFVDAARGNATTQLLVLGVLFTALTAVSDGAYAVMAGSLGSALRKRTRWVRRERALTGSTYIALGVAAAFSRAR